MSHGQLQLDGYGAEARNRAIAKLRRKPDVAYIDGTGCDPLAADFVAHLIDLPTLVQLEVDTIGHALQRAAAENA